MDEPQKQPNNAEAVNDTPTDDAPEKVVNVVEPVDPELLAIEAENATSTSPDLPEGLEVTMPTADNSTTSTGAPATTAAPQANAPAAATAAAVVPAPKRRKKKFILIGASAMTVISVVGVVGLQFLNKVTAPDEVASVSTVTQQVAKMGVAVALVDGTAEYLQGDAQWKPVTTDTQLKEGDSVRTTDGRVVLTLDDGSALRLDSQTSVRLDSLVATDVKIAQTSGTAYSRVVPSERSYTVTVDDTSYKAMGTAFATVSGDAENGVQVYQSSVKVQGVDEAVAEGKQYYKASKDAARKEKVTDISLDELETNEFVSWNLGEDEKEAKFKEKLGMLLKLKQRIAERKAAREAIIAAATEKATKTTEVAKKTETTETTKPVSDDKKRITRGNMTLTVSRTGKASWSYTGNALYGYKLVYSKVANPSYPNDSPTYISDGETSSAYLSIKKAGVYYVRVCAYTNGTEADGCVDYSNPVIYTKIAY